MFGFAVVAGTVIPPIWLLAHAVRYVFNPVCFAVAAAVAAVYIRAMSKRRAFIKELEVTCERLGFELSEIENKYSFIFSHCEGYNFTLKMHGKSYACKFLACNRRSVPMVFMKDGDGYWDYSIRLRKVTVAQIHIHFEYDFECGTGENPHSFACTT